MRRELAIVFSARVTWVVAAVAALLVGHGFILAVDLYAAASRSALASALQARELDPLAGIVVPTLGGLDLALAVLVPLVAARGLAVEKERNGFGALCLHAGSSDAVVCRKLAAAALGCLPLFVAPLVLFALFALVGGHLDPIESAIAIGGELLHAALLVTVALAAAAWTRSYAQAVAVGVVLSLASWAVQAGEDFAALAWMGGAEAWSIARHLAPFRRGVIAPGAALWFVVAACAAAAVAVVGARFDGTRLRRTASAAGAIVAAAGLMFAAGSWRRGYDWSEDRRASLPPAVVSALRAIDGPIALEVNLDRDDSRRRQLEADVVFKLALARPDLLVDTPLDRVLGAPGAARDERYGVVVARAGRGVRETRSTSRRELVTLVLEAAGAATPSWTQPTYPGFPASIEGGRRMLLVLVAYALLPAALLVAGFWLQERRTA